MQIRQELAGEMQNPVKESGEKVEKPFILGGEDGGEDNLEVEAMILKNFLE